MSLPPASLFTPTNQSDDPVDYNSELYDAANGKSRRPALYRNGTRFRLYSVRNPTQPPRASEFDSHLDRLLPGESPNDESWTQIKDFKSLKPNDAELAHKIVMATYKSIFDDGRSFAIEKIRTADGKEPL
jgi:hypothetical protein